MATAMELVNLVKTKVGCGYALTTQGEVLTPALLASLVKRFGRSKYYFLGYSAAKWLGKEVFDCSGLVVWALRSLGVFSHNEDFSAQGLYAQETTPITREALQPGDLVFVWNKAQKRCTHVGVYAGENKVVEAMGTLWGVKNSKMPASWNVFGRLKRLTHSPGAPVHETILRGSKGMDVRLLQTLLNQNLPRGIASIDIDGDFGPQTEKAVKAFQKEQKLTADGIVGPQTWKALLAKQK